MRCGTKLKHILKDHTIDVSIEHGLFRLTVFKKADVYFNENDHLNTYVGKTWSSVINQAYRTFDSHRRR